MKNTVLKSLALVSFITLWGCKESKPEREIVGKTKKEIVSFSPKITGRILKINVEEGQIVKVGDTLAILDVPEVSAKIAQARGATSAANANPESVPTTFSSTGKLIGDLMTGIDGEGRGSLFSHRWGIACDASDNRCF